MGAPAASGAAAPSLAAVAPKSAPAAPAGASATPVLGGAAAGPAAAFNGASFGSATHAALDAEVRQLEELIHGGAGSEAGPGGAGGGPRRSLAQLAAAVERLAADIGGEWLPADGATPRALLARTRALRAVVG